MKFITFFLATLFLLHFEQGHSQNADFEQVIRTNSDILMGQLGGFENSIYGLDVLGGKNDLRFDIEGEGIKMYLSVDGRLGVGTANPTFHLDVQDSTAFLISAEGDHVEGSRIRVSNTDTGGGIWDIVSTGSANAEGAGHLIFDQFNVAPRLIIRNDGNVGIGNNFPNDALDVTGDIDATGCIEIGDGASTLGGVCVSDARFKKNIHSLEDQLTKLLALRPVSFDWRTNSARAHVSHDIGLIAQEVEEVMPDMVETDHNGYKKVRYDISLQMRMIKAIQEQQEIINEQNRLLLNQQDQINNMSKELDQIRRMLEDDE